MAEASDTRGILRSNLIDAGCSGDMVARCMDYAQSGAWDELIAILAKHKTTMLESVREEQRKIDCLDYLVYRIGKDYKEEERKNEFSK